ncbi:MAG: cob(I)yrinic acid a,c-diamide adenosyltransferase [Desulfovibrio sp.]|jgi:cob(I)alamin adenosyltransferase|nr:cob(I)yrinic acid a,c-diamide adenosyltransferase [Desulfovibrio sp.]
MLLVYAGNGKGKTSSCAGQALRALGQGMRVAFGQFIKRDDQAGEQRMLRQLLGPRFYAGGLGFFRHEKDRDKHREAALRTLDWGRNILPESDMLVLDESLYALDAGLLMREELLRLIDSSEHDGRHLVLSGRNAPGWLVRRADIVTEMQEIKHLCRKGIGPTPGIEY